MSFADLGLSEKVLQAVTASGYTEPTPIQAQAIPHVLARRDVLGVAQTGTGKTAAFTLPMLSLLEHGRTRARMPRTLILEPTRELAAQVEGDFVRYGVNQKLSVALLIGGVSFGDQDVKITRGVDVLIATPGRLLDHHERGKLLLTGVELLVIDEADRMLDMGFIPDIERIAKLTPFTRQTLFFSATMPPEIQRLADAFLHNPVRIEVAKPASAAATITQRLVLTGSEPSEKRETLRTLIRGAKDLNNAIIFCNRKRDVAVLHRSLVRHGFNAVALHGDMDQRSRTNALESFRNGETKLLVASDVAARGLDIPAVSHVFNYDVPHHAEDYVHRIGRTGRAGRAGASFTLVSRADGKSLAAIEALIGEVVVWEGPTLRDAPPSTDARRSTRGGSRSREARPERDAERSRRGRSSREPQADEPRLAETPAEPESRRPAPAKETKPPRSDREPRPARQEDRPRDEARARRPENGSESVARREAPARRDAPSAPQEPRDRRRQGRHEQHEAEGPGFGDHVPAFLLRPPAAKPRK